MQCRFVRFTGQPDTACVTANNYASSLLKLRRFEEAKSLLRKTMPVARRVLGDTDKITLKLRLCYVHALHTDPAATLDDIREAVTTLEDVERIARRVLGGAHSLTSAIECHVQNARAAVAKFFIVERGGRFSGTAPRFGSYRERSARETPSPGGSANQSTHKNHHL